MATTTGSNNVYDNVKEYIGDGSIDMDNNAFGVMLLSSTYPESQSAHDFVDDVVTWEISGNNYSRQILATVQWIETGNGNGQMKLTSANPVWNAIGGSITAHYWVLYHDTPGSDATRHVIAYGFVDASSGGQDVVTTDGNSLTLNVPTDGYFTLG